MKKIFTLVSILIFAACGPSKKKTETAGTGTSLEQRLTEYMKLNDEMKLEQIMDYIYPKLFTIASKEQILKAMKDGFNNDELTVKLDSLKIEKVYPVFEIGKGSFAKVNYSMVMVMNIVEEAGTDKAAHLEKITIIAKSMEEEYGSTNVRVDDKGVIRIWKKNQMVAAKDEFLKEWSFVNLEEENPTMMSKLFSKEVLDKLATYN
jgi:hypothetical protein